MSEGIIAINPLMPYEDIRAGKIITPALGLGLGAFGMGAYQSMKDDDKKEIQKVEEGSPQPKPPEDKQPDIVSELAVKKGIDETQNKIKTWDYGGIFKDFEEVKQAAKENNVTPEDFAKAGVREQIKFKKTNLGYDVYFDGKLIGEMNDITQDLKDDNPDLYKGRKKVFNLHTLDSRGYPEPAFETIDTLADAKYVMKQVIASDLTNPESDTYRTFVKQKYDKKGLPIQEKAMGGFIDKPLPGRSRDI